MNSIQSKAALAVLLFLTFSAASSRAQMASNHDADTAAIKQFVANFADTWNSHDAHGVAMHYVEDGDFSSVKAEPSHGRKELEDHYNMIFTTFLKNAHTDRHGEKHPLSRAGPGLRGYRLAGDGPGRAGRRPAKGTAHVDFEQAERPVDDRDLPRAIVLISCAMTPLVA